MDIGAGHSHAVPADGHPRSPPRVPSTAVSIKTHGQAVGDARLRGHRIGSDARAKVKTHAVGQIGVVVGHEQTDAGGELGDGHPRQVVQHDGTLLVGQIGGEPEQIGAVGSRSVEDQSVRLQAGGVVGVFEGRRIERARLRASLPCPVGTNHRQLGGPGGHLNLVDRLLGSVPAGASGENHAPGIAGCRIILNLSGHDDPLVLHRHGREPTRARRWRHRNHDVVETPVGSTGVEEFRDGGGGLVLTIPAYADARDPRGVCRRFVPIGVQRHRQAVRNTLLVSHGAGRDTRTEAEAHAVGQRGVGVGHPEAEPNGERLDLGLG